MLTDKAKVCFITLQIPFHLVTRLWDTYLAEGDSLPDFLVYISASFLLTVSCLFLYYLLQNFIADVWNNINLINLDWLSRQFSVVQFFFSILYLVMLNPNSSNEEFYLWLWLGTMTIYFSDSNLLDRNTFVYEIHSSNSTRNY